MRKKFVAGNWKMNLTKSDAVALASGLAAKAAEFGAVEVGVIPAFVHIDAVTAGEGGAASGLGRRMFILRRTGRLRGRFRRGCWWIWA